MRIQVCRGFTNIILTYAYIQVHPVKDGNVWCTGKNLFQETTELGTMIEDIHTILTKDDDSLDELVYMHKLK